MFMLFTLYAFYQELASYENIFTIPEVKQLISSNDENFDLVLTEVFTSDVFTAFSHKFNAPLISIISSTALSWTAPRLDDS